MPYPSPVELLPDADYGFSMRMRPGDPAEFFAPSTGAAAVLAERTRWLHESPARYLAWEPKAFPLVTALRAFARNTAIDLDGCESTDPSPVEFLRWLGANLEPDFLVLSPDPAGRFLLRGGCVCFPSGWALEEKIGLPVEAIHGVVPGLNAAIGERIHQFLARLKPGLGWNRSNWGVSSSPELNQHPIRAVNRLAHDTPPETTWLRIEHQLLTGLPDSSAILFGIRLENVSLAQLKRDEAFRERLRRALITMPEAMAKYKNLADIRPALVAYLE